MRKTRAIAYRQAKEARKLLKDASKWTIQAWENLGWHWSLSKGNITISASDVFEGPTYFYALLSDGTHFGTGAVFWTDNYRSTDPNKVVAHQLKIAKRFVEKCQKSIQSVER